MHADRQEAVNENDFALNSDYEDEDDEWNEDDTWTYDGVEDPEDVKDESSAYLDFLSEEAAKFSSQLDDDDDDELEEESLLETPLDQVEPYAVLKGSLMSECLTDAVEFDGVTDAREPTELQQEQPQFYENMMKGLGQDEQNVLQAAVQQADTLAAQAQAAAAAAAQQGTANGSG